MWIQKNIAIEKKQKGFHLITDQLIDQIPEINKLNIGLLHVFILHTSASITLNENMDSSVRGDFNSFFNHLVPEDQNYFKHINTKYPSFLPPFGNGVLTFKIMEHNSVRR